MKILQKASLGLAGISALLLLTGIITAQSDIWQPAALGLAVFLAIGMGGISTLKGYQYTAWIMAAVVAGMVYPSAFLHWGNFDLRNKWLILIVVQLVMFGMGIQMKLRDFTGLATSGRGVLVGLLCQFSVMPLTGFLLTKVFHFEPEIAAGIILIGACSSGLASNVMAYIARANLVLSVTVTAIATLIAPIMTPFMMKVLAGTLINIKFMGMMIEIVKIVIVPISAALLHDYLKTASPKAWKNVKLLTLACILWLITLPLGLWNFLAMSLSSSLLQSAELLSFFTGAIVVGVAYHQLAMKFPRLNDLMPYFSMFGIIYFTLVTTAAGRDNLLQVGFLLFITAVIHNSAGYFFGFWFSRALGLNKTDARTLAFEVGLQNGGMASGLAGTMGKLGTLGLAAAVFSPWMNISGSIVANYWKRRPVRKEKEEIREVAVTSAYGVKKG